MEPTEKSKQVDDLLTELSGKNRPETIRANGCIFCETPNLNFKDEESRDEYRNSGMCQTCQDEFFNGDEE